jgi:hypothetical protein
MKCGKDCKIFHYGHCPVIDRTELEYGDDCEATYEDLEKFLGVVEEAMTTLAREKLQC